VTDRQEKVKGFLQQALAMAKVLLVGAGGLGSEISVALCRKGLGFLSILDMDVVSVSNISRQKYFPADLGKNKAHRLAKNLVKESYCGTVIQGYSVSLQDAIAWGVDLSSYQLVIVGVDNNPTRVLASRFFRQAGTPVIFSAVSADANWGYIFVQEPGNGKACWGCMFPDSINDERWPCGTPAVIDIVKVVSGMAVYAVDTLLMPRLRTWNYKSVYLCGFPGNDWQVERKEDCQLCGAAGA
jgi:molybdopterin/thiamine biosynthesis adenylyltransferase